jgi:hypothetical protein
MPVKTQIFPARAARSETLCGYQSSGVSSAKFSTVSFMPSREGEFGINAETRRTLRPAKLFESPSGWHICRNPNQ